MTKYVCGFFFDRQLNNVVLIWKNKPKWQEGKLNGVGGKIEEGETPKSAMMREFQEETGLAIAGWLYLITISGEDWSVDFLCSRDVDDVFEYAETKESEEVAKIPVDSLGDFDYIPNLQWLIPMAINKIEQPGEHFAINYHP